MSAQRAGKIFLSCHFTFCDSTNTISRFGERFHGGQYSLVSFLFAVLLMVSPWPAICKSGGGARAPMFYGVGATAIPQTNMISLSNCGSYLWHKNNTVLLNRPYRVQTAYFPNARHFSTVGLNGKSRCPGYVPSLLSSHVLILMRLEFSLKFWVQKKHKNIIIWW